MMTTTELRRVEDQPAPGTGRRRRRIVLGLVLAVVLAVFVTWLVAFSSAFGVRSVQIKGTRIVTTAQVLAAAHVARGTPLLRLDTAAVTRRVERLADVESARVGTSFPSTVIITVRERTPVGYVDIAGGAMLVDRTGAPYRTVSSPPATVPRLLLPTGAGGRATASAVAAVAASLPANLRVRVKSIGALDPASVTLVLNGGTIVRWGSADHDAQKVRILDVLGKRQVGQIDVTDPDRPFTRHS